MISKAPEASTCVADPTRSSGSEISLHRILLIVSDTMMQLNLSSRLRMAGFEVLVVSGTEAAKSRLHSFNPHAVVLDLGMEDPPFEKFASSGISWGIFIEEFQCDPRNSSTSGLK